MLTDPRLLNRIGLVESLLINFLNNESALYKAPLLIKYTERLIPLMIQWRVYK